MLQACSYSARTGFVSRWATARRVLAVPERWCPSRRATTPRPAPSASAPARDQLACFARLRNLSQTATAPPRWVAVEPLARSRVPLPGASQRIAAQTSQVPPHCKEPQPPNGAAGATPWHECALGGLCSRHGATVVFELACPPAAGGRDQGRNPLPVQAGNPAAACAKPGGSAGRRLFPASPRHRGARDGRLQRSRQLGTGTD